MARILMLHPHDIRYFPWTIRIIKFAEILGHRGHEVTLVHPTIPEWDLRKQPRDPIFEPPPDAPYRVMALGSRIRNFPDRLRIVSDLAREADIIHVQKCHPGTMLPALYASRKHDKPIHYDWDDFEEAIALVSHHGAPRGWIRLLRHYERTVHRFAETLSVASEGLRNLALSRGVPEHLLYDAPVGADLTLNRPDRDGTRVREKHGLSGVPLVLYLGQLEGAAYAELLLSAVGLVRGEIPEARFLIVGGGGMLEYLKRKAAGMGLEQQVLFAGYVNREFVPDYVAAADVAVACFEDNEVTRCKSPLKIAEYLAAGKPIVASRVGDVPKMLGPTGILTEPGDSVSLAEGILTYLHNPALRKEASLLARNRAETIYNWETTVDNLERAYRFILGSAD